MQLNASHIFSDIKNKLLARPSQRLRASCFGPTNSINIFLVVVKKYLILERQTEFSLLIKSPNLMRASSVSTWIQTIWLDNYIFRIFFNALLQFTEKKGKNTWIKLNLNSKCNVHTVCTGFLGLPWNCCPEDSPV